MATQTNPNTVPAYVPRSDVGTAGLSGVLATVIMMVLNNDGIYNFDAVYALIFGLAVAAAGYMVPRNKSFVMLVAAPVATLVAAALGRVLYNVEWDNAAVSAALSIVHRSLVRLRRPATTSRHGRGCGGSTVLLQASSTVTRR